MQTAGLIVAAGRGERLGGDTPKQYLDLGGRTVLRHSVETFLSHPGIASLCVVIHPQDRELCERSLAGLESAKLLPPALGGATRSASVRAGLEALSGATPDAVLIHDGARPFVDHATLSAVIEALGLASGAFPALPVVDALWSARDGAVAASRPREALWRAQTPQGFRFMSILHAHRAHVGNAADDVAVAMAAGLDVRVVAGSEENFKITSRADLERAERRLVAMTDIRTGNGFDVHQLGPGAHVTLCGIEIPHQKGLVGHSDSDVGMHAVTDAILGALAEGDIGQWFPSSDPQWKGAASEIFLTKAVERACARGFAITHLDCTLICEQPKIGPHAPRMRAELARIAGIEAERVSVKATTSETLGFTGRGEGIAALATATLVKP
jgi:2-C-methyl-D-erythritol 4-phosphate cytidylyltransferase / 2-C-methyl-D-erythritol 2,4-cyclodiphosphate synthase